MVQSDGLWKVISYNLFEFFTERDTVLQYATEDYKLRNWRSFLMQCSSPCESYEQRKPNSEILLVSSSNSSTVFNLLLKKLKYWDLSFAFLFLYLFYLAVCFSLRYGYGSAVKFELVWTTVICQVKKLKSKSFGYCKVSQLSEVCLQSKYQAKVNAVKETSACTETASSYAVVDWFSHSNGSGGLGL